MGSIRFGKAVRICRERRGLGIWQASRLGGISALCWYLIECERIPLRLKSLAKISEGLGSTPYELVKEFEEDSGKQIPEKR